MPEAVDAAIEFRHVNKTYRVYESLASQALDVFGLGGLRFLRRSEPAEFHALRDIHLQVARGGRLGVIGRNGAGKTTLLRLMTGNFRPSEGEIEVQGSVQALMNIGLGFHPDFTGIDNVRSSMVYNGLPQGDVEAAIEDVIDFAELGDFLYQPVKNYSLGMGMRLMFATATAIRPDILIIDEVLGAGDAYFAAKSAARMSDLVNSGCTLILVSHSMQQILQYCTEAIWLEEGRVVMRDSALAVVKAYEEFIHHLEQERKSREIGAGAASGVPAGQPGLIEGEPDWVDRKIASAVLAGQTDACYEGSRGAVSSGGVSRWRGSGGLLISSVTFRDTEGEEASMLRTDEPLNVDLEVTAERSGRFPASFVLAVFDATGNALARFCSATVSLELSEGDSSTARLELDPLMLGNGEYMWSAAVYEKLDLAHIHTARYYDLLARSFRIEVIDRHRDDPSVFHHPHRWRLPADATPELG